MRIKDYYSILEIPPGASLPDVKKAYRRLAMQYHPDKQAGNDVSDARFDEIKEAYEVLTDPGRKKEYLEKRWYNQVMNLRTPPTPTTTDAMLKQLVELRKHILPMDRFRMDKYGLYEYLDHLFSGECVAMLNQTRDTPLADRIVEMTLPVMESLPPALREKFLPRLFQLEALGPGSVKQIRQDVRSARLSRNWARWRLPLLVALVVVICVAIFYLSR